MSADASLDLQAAIVAALAGDADLAALVGDRVVSRPRADVFLPYVAVAPVLSRPWDSDTMAGAVTTMQVSAWSRGPDRVEAARIAAAIWAALHDVDLALAGRAFVLGRVTDSRLIDEDDGETTHAVVRLDYTTHLQGS